MVNPLLQPAQQIGFKEQVGNYGKVYYNLFKTYNFINKTFQMVITPKENFC